LKPSLYIKSETEIDSASAVLLVIAGNGHCCFAVMNHLSKELVEYGYYTWDNSDGNYRALFEDVDAMKKRYHQTAVAYDSAASILVPAALFNADDVKIHLQTVYGKDFRSAVISEILPAWKLTNVYRVPDEIFTTVSKKLQPGYSLHLYSVLLKNINSAEPGFIMLDFRTEDFSVIVIKENNLQLAQSFDYSAPEDVLYHLLKICQQTGLSQQDTKIYLSGLIEQESSIYRELDKYFIQLEFETLSGDIKLSDELKVYPEHYFSTISKLAACV
jgi:hypothetical protein